VMQRSAVIIGVLMVLSLPMLAQKTRDWQSGMLMETEQQKVKTGTIHHANTDGTAKDNGNKTNYSQNTTVTSTDDYDTFQVYTIQGPHKTYIAREQLLFPWSKPANVTVGENVKYVVEKNKLIILDDDGKQHKAGITKVSVNPAH
jgi:hypothetical protein